MKEWFVYQERGSRHLCERNTYAVEDMDCVGNDVIAGSLRIIDADCKVEALVKYGLDAMEIVYKFSDDIAFMGYEQARKEWLNL